MTIERRVRIVRDSDAYNPRTDNDCNVGRMLCWHNRYSLGDSHDYDCDTWKAELACEADDNLADKLDYIDNEMYEAFSHCYEYDGSEAHDNAVASTLIAGVKLRNSLVNRAFDAGYVAIPLYLYDHSGITMSTSRFGCMWDSGCVGVIICDKKTIQREFNGDRGKALRALKAEVEIYDAYISGEVYGFIAESRCSDNCTECSNCEDWNEVDSCWGFYGSDIKTNGIKDYLDSDFDDATVVYE